MRMSYLQVHLVLWRHLFCIDVPAYNGARGKRPLSGVRNDHMMADDVMLWAEFSLVTELTRICETYEHSITIIA